MANLSNINNKFLVTTGGNVGINVTGPTKKIDVYQDTVGLGAADFRHVNGNRILINPSYNYYDAYNHIFRGLNGTDTHMTIDLNGNVGIGTTSPFTNLEIEGSGLDSIIRLYAASGAANIRTWEIRAVGVAGEGLLFRQVNDANNSYTNRMIIDTSGNVGIGTASPLVRLQLEKTVSAATSRTAPVNLMYLTSEHPSVGYGGFGTAITHYSKTYQNLTKTEQSKIAFTQQGNSVSTAGSTIDFYTKTLSTGSAAPDLRMRINYNGNVGIGTITPDYKLEVQGVISSADAGLQKATFANVGNDLVLTANADATNVTANILFKSSGSGGASVSEKMRIDSSGNVNVNSGRIRIAGGGSDSGTQLNLWSDTNGYCFIAGFQTIFHQGGNNSRSEVMRITSTGLGIGVTSPSVKLEVQANATSYGVKTQYSTVIFDGNDSQLDITSSSAGSWGSSINFVEGAGATNTDIWSIARQTTGGSGDSSLRFNFGTINQHANSAKIVFASNGAIGIGGTNYGAAGEVLTSNGNAAPSWQAAGGGGSAWPQEKFAEYTIDSTTSNILIATMNPSTWHGNELAGCLKFTINASDYIQVSYITVSTFLSGTNQWFFKGNSEMTTRNNGTNPIRYVFAFAGNNGSFGTTCTLKINRVSNTTTYTKVNVLVQAISSPDMFILN